MEQRCTPGLLGEVTERGPLFLGEARRRMRGRGHLESVLRIYAEHYNAERPHRGLDLATPDAPQTNWTNEQRAFSFVGETFWAD